jgi:hypothetical protein
VRSHSSSELRIPGRGPRTYAHQQKASGNRDDCRHPSIGTTLPLTVTLRSALVRVSPPSPITRLSRDRSFPAGIE